MSKSREDYKDSKMKERQETNELAVFYDKNKINYMLAIIAQILSSLANIIIAFFLMIVVEALELRSTNMLYQGLILGAVLIILYLLAAILKKIFINRFIMRALSNYKSVIFKKILEKDIGSFGDTSSGRYINAFTNDLASIEQNYLLGTVQMIYYIFLLVATLIAMGSINLSMLIAVLLACIVPITYAVTTGNKLVVKEKKTSEENESFVDQVKDLLNGFIVIKSFKAENEALSIFESRNFVLESAKKERREANDNMEIIGVITSMATLVVIFILGAYLTFNGIIGIGVVFGFVQLSNYLIEPIQQLYPLASNRKAAKSLVSKVSNVLESSEDRTGEKEVNEFENSLALKDVNFSYDGKNIVLKNINTKFEKGKSYAVVGVSGSGKTTLFKLLQGFFEDYEGEILVDNTELREVSANSLIELFGVIQQNVFLFDTSIKNNITLFNDFDKEKVDRVIDQAGLRELVDEKGYDYECGEGGRNLSGGEQQRVSIARALLKKSKILLLDEATSALDVSTANEINKAILAIPGLTKIVITHKIDKEQLEKYDEIIALKDGGIIEQGEFNELISKKDYFYSLYNLTGI